MLDLTKPIQTRDGRKVRILCIDASGTYLGQPHPIVGIIENQPPSTWSADGSFANGAYTHNDLVNVPAPRKKVKVEVRLAKDAFDGSIMAIAYSDQENAHWSAGSPNYLASTTIEMEYAESQQ